MQSLVFKFFVVIVVGFGASVSAETQDDFRFRRSTLDAVERQLKRVKTPHDRLQLVLRWIKIKEQMEEDPSIPIIEGFSKVKYDIIDRLHKEIQLLSGQKGVSVQPLYRELAFRYLEVRKYPDSLRYFGMLNQLTDEDRLAFGDALGGSGELKAALAKYDEVAKNPMLRTIASYKKGWVFIRLNQFSSALESFDSAIHETNPQSAQVREEAFRDRWKPFLESFTQTDFNEQNLASIKTLAAKAKPQSQTSQKKLTTDALQFLIEGFNAKAKVNLAERVFHFYALESPDSEGVLFHASPLWLKIYRGNLDHASVERILNSLPNKALDPKKVETLYAEMNNTAVFYETLVSEEAEAKKTEGESRAMLLKVYQKFFTFFPKDADADGLRVNYGRLLLEDGRADVCLTVLEGRSKKDAEVEKVASNLEGRCDLKHLDQLYALPHSEIFYAKLNKVLTKDKVYTRDDLGMTSEQAFEALTRMLIGSLKKNTQSATLIHTLNDVLLKYPYDKSTSLYRDLQIVAAEVRFGQLTNQIGKEDSEKLAKEFYRIFLAAPPETEVAQKSMVNSILLSPDKASLDRCAHFQKSYPDKFKKKEEIFTRCVQLSEQYLDLEREYGFWIFQEKHLDQAELIRVGLLELALGTGKGMSRLKSLKASQAGVAIVAWEIRKAEPRDDGKSFDRLEKRVDEFTSSLKAVKVDQIQKAFPSRLKAFEDLDLNLVNFYQKEPSALARSRALLSRAQIASALTAWIKSLPEPKGLTPEELAQYRLKAAEVVKPWELRAEQRDLECSQLAYAISIDFKNADGKICAEKTPEAVLTAALNQWKESQQLPPNESPWGKDDAQALKMKSFRALISAADATSDLKRARYFLLRALDLADTNYLRARVHLALAKKFDEERSWIAASTLDGKLVEPVQWWHSRAKSNPFFERLYTRQLQILGATTRVSGK